MKPYTNLALKARKFVTFQPQIVPTEWQRIHGPLVYKAIAARGKTDLKKFGLAQPDSICSLLGLKSIHQIGGSFSFI